MAESLKTVLGFEATDAIKTLAAMETQLKSWTAAMRGAASATQKFNKDAAGVSATIKKNTAAAAIQTKQIDKTSVATTKQTKAVKELGNKTKEASKDMILSWKSVIRIFTIQVIHQMISKITSSLSDAVSSTIELENRLAEIQTIGGSLKDDFEGLSDSVRDLSDEFGIQAETVAEGVYQTLSNQVAEAEKSFIFFSAAAQFSIAAVTSADAAVNLIAATINAFGYSAAQAEVIGGKLFKTIELGRIRGEEFANTFGRVAVLASNLGVSLDEVLAAIATLTISGLKYNEAFTLITNTLLKLIRPTDALKDVYEDMGLVSAEAAIQAFGFFGFLNQLADAAGGTATEIGELFSRVRAVRGILGLTGQAAEKVAKNLEAISEAGSKELFEAKELVFQTNAKAVQIEMEELRNALLFDFGRPAIAVIAELFDTFGGAVNILKALTASAGVAAIAFAALGVAMYPLTATVIGISAAVFTLTIAYQKLTETAVEGIEIRIKAEKRAIQEINTEEAELAETRIKHIKGQFGQIQRYLIERIKATNKIKKIAIEAEEYITNIINDQLDDRASAHNSFVDAIKDITDESADNIIASQKRTFSLEQELSSTLFNFRISQLDTYEKHEAALSQAGRLRFRAEQAFRDGHKEYANSLFQEAKTVAQIAITTAEELGSHQAKQSAVSSLTGIYNSQLSIQKRIRGEEVKRAKLAKSQLAEETARVDRIITIMRKLQEIDIFVKTGKKAGEMIFGTPAEAKAAVLPLLKAYRKELDGFGSKISIFKRLDLEKQAIDLLKPFEDAFTRKPVSLEFLYKQRIVEVYKDIENLFKDKPIPLPVRLIAEKLEIDISTLKGHEELSRVLPGIFSTLEKGIRATAGLKGEQQELDNANRNVIDSLKAIRGELIGDISVFKAFGVAAKQALGIAPSEATQKLIDQFKLINDATIQAQEQIDNFTDPEQFDAAITKLEEFGDISGITLLVEQLKIAAETAQTIKIKEGQKSSIVEFTEILNKISPEFMKTGVAAQEAANSILSSSNQIQNTLRSEIELIRQRNRELGGTSPVGQHFGGMIYRQLGGFLPQGTDTVPAMLSPGEFVINADATKKFYSQLVAINSGTKPIFREQGGPVTNVGDVSITVNESVSAKTTARDTMSAFRREMRRHTSRSF